MKTAAEAAEWLDTALGGASIPPLVVAIGAADGHLLDVLEQRAPHTRVLVLEPDRATADAFLKRRDWTRWRESGRLAYLVGPDYAGADQAWRVFPTTADALKVLLHPALAQDRQRTVAAMQVFKRIQFGVKANAIARRKFAPRYLANVLRNVPAMVAGRDVGELTGVYRGIPAVIAAAGPSLDRAIDDLHALRGRAVLIAVDTALRPLLHAGLMPHLVVGADPGAANARHFQALPECPDTWLVSESALDRSATSHFDGRTFWFRLARHHPWPWLQEMGIDVSQVEMWGSVLTAAFQVACLAGCDPIVLVGADLAFTGGRPYCRGTTYEFDWARETSGGSTLQDVWNAQMSKSQTIRVPDVRGAETTGTTTMQSFRDWMVAAAVRSGRRVINASGAGTLFGTGVEQMSLRDALAPSHLAPSHLAPSPLAPSHLVPSIASPDVARRLREAQEDLRMHGDANAPIADWAAFLEDGFQPSAIEAALQGALDELDHNRTSRRTSAINWSDAGTRARLTQLPETLARFRAALAGGERSGEMSAETPAGPKGPALRVPDRSAVLKESFELLHRICQETRGLNRLPFAAKPWQVGQVPVSSLFEWPDAVRWPVEFFEAMLEDVWAPPCNANGTFLTRRVRLRDTAASPVDTHLVPVRHDNARHACLLLALEWLRCALGPRSDDAGIASAIAQSIAAVAAAASTRTPYATAKLVIRLQTPSSSENVDLEVPVADAAFVRHLTGTPTEPEGHQLVSMETHLCRASFVLRAGGAESAPASVRTRPRRWAPRVLTDECVAGGLLSYRSGDGMGCVLYQKHESVVVQPDGSVRPLHRWPRPVVGELPLGDEGAVAWGDGLSGYPDRIDPGYVMYKHRRDGEIVIQDLPVRPTIGRWWQGRVYWNCHPRRIESPMGLVSWAPGDAAPQSELPDLPAIIGMHSGEDGLRFEIGGGHTHGGKWVRRFERSGWTWRPGTELQPIDMGQYGAAAARDTHGTWTAIAHPEADLIRLESTDGREHSMACYYPINLAWVGNSLLVGTIEPELLLFENLAVRLEERP